MGYDEDDVMKMALEIIDYIRSTQPHGMNKETSINYVLDVLTEATAGGCFDFCNHNIMVDQENFIQGVVNDVMLSFESKMNTQGLLIDRSAKGSIN